MIYSMTAFARTQYQGVGGNFVCEIRSVNHRYLEMNLHLSDLVRVFEMPIREAIRDAVKRGKVECIVRYQVSGGGANTLFTLNMPLVNELARASEQIAATLTLPGPVSPTDILRYPGVLEAKEANLEVLKKEVMDVVEKTLQDFVAVRGREGEDLKKLFIQRIDLMQAELIKVRDRLPSILSEQREKLLKKIQDMKVDLDNNRLEQEMVIYAQRIDVAEEIDRTETHIAEVRRILKEGGMVGRRLDFLLQELNREANTLGSKSTDPLLTQVAVELKVLIEQIREQVQNVE